MSGSELFGPCFVVKWLRWCVWVVWVPQNLMVCQHCRKQKTDILSIPPFSTSRVILLLVTSGYIPLCAHYGWFYTPYPTQIWCLNVILGGSSHGRVMFTSTKLVAPVAQVMSLHLLKTLSIESVFIIHIILYTYICQIHILYLYIYIYIPRSLYQHLEAFPFHLYKAEETTFSLLRAVKSAKVPLSFSQLRNVALLGRLDDFPQGEAPGAYDSVSWVGLGRSLSNKNGGL